MNNKVFYLLLILLLSISSIPCFAISAPNSQPVNHTEFCTSIKYLPDSTATRVIDDPANEKGIRGLIFKIIGGVLMTIAAIISLITLAVSSSVTIYTFLPYLILYIIGGLFYIAGMGYTVYSLINIYHNFDDTKNKGYTWASLIIDIFGIIPLILSVIGQL